MTNKSRYFNDPIPQLYIPTSAASADNQQGIFGNMVDKFQGDGLSALGGMFDMVGAEGIAKQFYGWSEEQYQQMSDAGREAMSRQFFEEDEDGNIRIGEGLTSLDTWLLTMAGVAGQFAATAIPGAGAAGAVARAASLGSKGRAAANVVGMGATGGAAATGQGMEQAREEVRNMPDELLADSAIFRDLYLGIDASKPDWNEEQKWDAAKEALAAQVAREVQTDPVALAANFGASAIGDPIIGRALTGARLAKNGAFRSAVRGALIEGSTEAVQAGTQQYSINQALQPIDGRDDMDGVGLAAINEGLAGAGFGGVAGGFGGIANRQPKDQPAQAQETGSPISPGSAPAVNPDPSMQLPPEMEAELNRGMDPAVAAVAEQNPTLGAELNALDQASANRQRDVEQALNRQRDLDMPTAARNAGFANSPQDVGRFGDMLTSPAQRSIAELDEMRARTVADMVAMATQNTSPTPQDRFSPIPYEYEVIPAEKPKPAGLLSGILYEGEYLQGYRAEQPPAKIEQKDIIFAGDNRPAQQAQERSQELERMANRFADNARNQPARIPQKDVIFAGNETGVTVKQNGQPFQSPKEALTSKSARDAKKAGNQIEAVPFADGYGWQVAAPNISEQAPSISQATDTNGGTAISDQAAVMQSPETDTAPSNAQDAQARPAPEPVAEVEAAPVQDDAAQLDNAEPAADLAGEAIDPEWTAFADDTGTKKIPRAEMPQIKAEHRGAMVQFMRGRDITHEQDTVPAVDLKPTQAEFSPAKVKNAMEFDGGNRSILVSSDGYVLDGHHQWLAAREKGESVDVIRLNAPIDTLIPLAREFPSSTVADGAMDASPEIAVSETNQAPEQSGVSVSEDAESEVKPAERKATKRNEKLQDAGDSLFANKKGWFSGSGIKWSDIANENDTLRVSLVSKQKVWPKPNWETIINSAPEAEREAFMPIVHMVKQVYDAISTKPTGKADQALQDYIEAITKTKEAAEDLLSNKEAQFNLWNELASRAARRMASPYNIGSMATKGDMAPIFAKVFPQVAAGARFKRGDRENDLAIQLGSKAIKVMQFDASTAVNALKDIDKGWPAKQEAWQKQGYSVVETDGSPVSLASTIKRKDGDIYSARVDFTRTDNGKTVRVFLGSYDSYQEAKNTADKYANENSKPFALLNKRGNVVSTHNDAESATDAARSMTKRETGKKLKDEPLQAEDVRREGPERRKDGRDVSPQELMEAFGFRGVNFGNWVKANERQWFINQAYDGFYDLAETLDLPPKAISLNGMLGVAFGAQGNSGANAHFVPGFNEINLTKNTGAGALAHEWGHALDHYFGVRAGLGKLDKPFATSIEELTYRQKQLVQENLDKDGGIRSVIRDAFVNISALLKEKTETMEAYTKRIRESKEKSLNSFDEFTSNFKDQLNADGKAALNDLRAGNTGEYVNLPPPKGKRKSPGAVYQKVKDVADSLPEYFADPKMVMALHREAISVYYTSEQVSNAPALRKIHTDFYSASRSTDASKGGKSYWSTNVEMFARAFESYVMDRMAEKNQINDFLVRPNKADRGKSDDTFPYPAGIERKEFNALFDTLLGAIETKESDDGNVILFSKASTQGTKPAKGVPVSVAQREADRFVERLSGAAGIKVQILPTQKDAEKLWRMSLDGDFVRGAYSDQTGTVYIIAENARNMTDLRQTIAHELFAHGGLDKVIGSDKKQEFLNRLKGTRSKKDFKGLWSQIDRDYDGMSEDVKAEELFAYFVQNQPQRGPVKFWWNAFKRWLNNILANLGITSKGDPDVDLMQSMMESIMFGFQFGRQADSNAEGGLAFSKDGDPTNPDIRFSKTKGQPDNRTAKEKLGLDEQAQETLKEKAIQSYKNTADTLKSSKFWQRLNEGIFDGLAGIKAAEVSVGVTDPNKQGYVSARLASGLADVLHGVFHYGAPQWKDGVVARKPDTKGLLEVFSSLGDDLSNWLAWMGANRAEKLMTEGRENNLTAADIAELKALASGKEQLFEDVRKEYNKINSAIIDLAQEAGLISAEQRAGFDEEWYVPFFRDMDVDPEMQGIAAMVHGPKSRNGIANQNAQLKELKGGKQSTRDLLENIIQRHSTLIDASLKNNAMLEIVRNLGDSDYMQAVTSPDIAALSQTDLNKLQKVKVMRDGKPEAYAVSDAALLRGLLQINDAGSRSLINKLGRSAKRFLTAGITLSPDFIVKNFVRDAAHAWMVNKDEFKFGSDSIKGLQKAFKEDEAYRDLIFSGAAFQGGYVHGADPEAAAQQVRRALEQKGLNKKQIESYMGSLVTKGSQLLERYRNASDKVENANRLMTYESALKAGKSTREAAFSAKDLMDYSLKGNFALIGTMIDFLPFFNARLQGMSKLVRAAKAGNNDRVLKVLSANLAMKGMKVAAFSLALAALHSDDERYKELADWDKDSSWHFWLGDDHIRIPKPFELGIIFGTFPERMLHFSSGNQPSSDLAKAVGHAVFNTLALNPIPQVALPIFEVAFNKSFFRGTDIENMSDENKLKEDRYNSYTSDTAKLIGKISGHFNVSPKQVEHLVIGYTGTIGGYVLSISDVLARKMLGIEAADAPISRYPVIKAFYQGSGPKTNTKFQQEFYDALKAANQAYGSYKRAAEEGNTERQQMLLEKNKDKLSSRIQLNRLQRQISELNKQADRVNINQSLTGEQKRERLDEIARRKNALYQAAYVRFNLGEW